MSSFRAGVIERVKAGKLGNVVSVEIMRGWAYPSYEGGPLPPWYRSAGHPFRDHGGDCLYLIQELLGPIENVEATWSSHGGDPNLVFDDWRATVHCARGLAQVQLTYTPKPTPWQLIVHGTKGVLRLPNAFQRLAWKLKRAAEPPPVAAEDAAEVARWVEQVARAADADQAAKLAKFTLTPKVPFLVTGAAGALGTTTVNRLLADGHRVRAFVRRSPEHPQPNVEYCFGNLGDPEAVDRAVRGAETVIHAGAATKGGWPEHKVGTVVGTENVIASCTKHAVKQLVYISSMSVIDWAGSVGNGSVSESAALEPRASERGAYTRAKLEAEKLVADAAAHGLPCVILRPGQIFGGGIPLISGAVARNAGGRWLILGDGKLEVPLVYIDDVVDAIVQSVIKQLTTGQIIQIIDPEHLTQEDVLGLAGSTKPIVRVPRPIVFALGKLSEYPLGALGRQSPIAAYRLRSALARLHYESGRAHDLLGWQPRVGVREGIKRVAS